MSTNKKYYYLKLKENFFDSEDLKIIESMENGYLYANLYLKMILLSLKHEGRLVFKGRIPYDEKMLATVTGIDIDHIRCGIKILNDYGLIELLESGVIYMSDIQSLIGRGSSEAERKAIYRKKISTEKKIMGQCPGQIPPELELELELKKELDIERGANKISSFKNIWNTTFTNNKIDDIRFQIELSKNDRIRILETFSDLEINQAITNFSKCVNSEGHITRFKVPQKFIEVMDEYTDESDPLNTKKLFTKKEVDDNMVIKASPKKAAWEIDD